MDEMDEYQEWLHMTWGFGMESGVMEMSMYEDKYRGMTEEEREEERRKMKDRAIHVARPTGAMVDFGLSEPNSVYQI